MINIVKSVYNRVMMSSLEPSQEHAASSSPGSSSDGSRFNSGATTALVNNHRGSSTNHEQEEYKEQYATSFFTNNETEDSNNHYDSIPSTTNDHIPPIGFLEYPRDFFQLKSGANPANCDEAAKLWQFRKNRPPKGATDPELPNGEIMMKEVMSIRRNLRAHITEAYFQEIRESAKKYNMMVNTTNTYPVIKKDFNYILCNLPNTKESSRMVWDVFHKPIRHRLWLSTKLDEWFVKNKMFLMIAPILTTINEDDQEKLVRHCATERGGFSAVARQAKAEVVRGFMSKMYNKVGWCVASVEKKTKFTKFTKITLTKEDTFYICTPDKNSMTGDGTKVIILLLMIILFSTMSDLQFVVLCYCCQVPPGGIDEERVLPHEQTGEVDALESIGLDTKMVAHDISAELGCSMSEEALKFILKKNLGKIGHTGKIIKLNATKVNEDGTTHTLTSAITYGTSIRMTKPQQSSSANNAPTSSQRHTTFHDEIIIEGFDPTDPNSPTSKAFYKKNPHLATSEDEDDDDNLLPLLQETTVKNPPTIANGMPIPKPTTPIHQLEMDLNMGSNHGNIAPPPTIANPMPTPQPPLTHQLEMDLNIGSNHGNIAALSTTIAINKTPLLPDRPSEPPPPVGASHQLEPKSNLMAEGELQLVCYNINLIISIYIQQQLTFIIYCNVSIIRAIIRLLCQPKKNLRYVYSIQEEIAALFHVNVLCIIDLLII